MAEIRLEGYEVLMSGTGHLYLVYQNDTGQEFVIRGGPASDKVPGFSDIVVEVGVPIGQSEDSPETNPAERGSMVLDLGGRDAATVWSNMLIRAAQVDASETNYDTNGPNSNTTVSSVLDSVGIDIETVLPELDGVTGGLFGFDAWEGIGDTGLLNTFGSLNDLSGSTAISLFSAQMETLKNAIGTFFPGNEVPEFREFGTPHPQFSEGKTEGDFYKLMFALEDVSIAVDKYIKETSESLESSEISILRDISIDASNASEDSYAALMDPLVIDLDGDGIETIALMDSHANFDLFIEEGITAKHGWLSADDGFLAIDKNANGEIDGLDELFGNSQESGFSALSSMDTNGDAQITADDSNYSDLLIWRDLNGDGVSQTNEISSLAEEGIERISLNAEKQTALNNGNLIKATSTVDFSDGRSTTAADVDFGIDLASLSTNGKSDIFDFRNITDDRRINAFEDEIDQIHLSGSGFNALEFQDTESGAIVTTENGVDVFIAGLHSSKLSSDDFLFG